MTQTKRTDAHRPSIIVPAHYEQWLDYSLASQGAPAWGVNCAAPVPVFSGEGKVDRYEYPVCPDTGRCCVASMRRSAQAEGRAIFGEAGRCGVCGAHFLYGTAFRHQSGEIVHMGHDCATKYEMLFDLSAWELEQGRQRAAQAKQIQREQNAAARVAFLIANPGLAEAFETCSHAIVADIKKRFVQYCSLSEKQVALVLKLAAEAKAPKVEEAHVPAPTGKQTFRGTVVAVKNQEGDWGTTTKITVKVQTEGGTWLAWGTCPAALLEGWTQTGDGPMVHIGEQGPLKGQTVEITATLKQGRDAHFALMSRPRGRLLA